MNVNVYVALFLSVAIVPTLAVGFALVPPFTAVSTYPVFVAIVTVTLVPYTIVAVASSVYFVPFTVTLATCVSSIVIESP